MYRFKEESVGVAGERGREVSGDWVAVLNGMEAFFRVDCESYSLWIFSKRVLRDSWGREGGRGEGGREQ